MESDALYGDVMVELICRLSGNLIYHVFSMKAPDDVQISFTVESP